MRTTALAFVALTIPVVALVAWKSRLNSFPDEALHVTTASYYLSHWLPPKIGPELAPYAGVHGVSYFMLWPPQASYLLFAKASQLAFASDATRWLAYRGFCVGLWLILVAYVLREARRTPSALLVVGLTPQVWYIFTYFSADALSYAVASVLAVLLAVPESPSRRFMETGKPVAGGILLGACFGGLALSKMNYMTFAFFAVVYCGVLAWRLRATPGLAKRAALVAVVGALVAGPLLVVDVVNNGVDRSERFEQLREELAAPKFKPSDITAGDAYKGLGLRERGVSFRAMFSRPWRWGLLTYRSFFGVYGTMDIFSPPGVNGVQRIAAIALLVLAWLFRKRPLTRDHMLLLGAGALMIVASLAAAFWRAWTFDFQAQGRYVFAIIPIATVLLIDCTDRRQTAVQWGAFAVLALLGLLSILSALPHLV